MCELTQFALNPTNICGQTCLVSPDYLTSTHCVLIFTGNPSLLGLYCGFCEGIQKRIQGVSFIVVSLHCTPIADIIPTWRTSLYEGVKVKLNLVDYLEHHMPKDVKYTLITHSLGAFMALHVLPQRPLFTQKIAKIIHLFPAIRDLKKSIDLPVRMLAHIPLTYPLISLVTYILKLLPLFLFTLFIQTVSTTPKFLSQKLQSELNPHHLAQVAYFTLDEEKIITKHDELTIKCLKSTADKTTVVFGLHDKYTPLYVRNEFKENYKDIKVIETETKHAFVLGKTQEMLDFFDKHNII
ncbi:hypothetical protein EIN_129080 [Entamoeba invadens IP1]|uniref:Lipid droplet-associated serine hydrolase n=1 Tax=Entamoeba invadens IP1 TaxID=370355 RepID=L7FMC5_ENTIV|nr:hypothetical protein EIN_129080 [Entamoeba invadens IP1]ELP91568.1 hypothetical protein EIN_129080 [Entamoeba invadens IP1]|eukprot:XP_004258339.1 hypothetical protein EIN_129080 [Entamoeba invadens IP1]